MKPCPSCGHKNWMRQNVEHSWFCCNCKAKIENAIDKDHVITKGCSLTPKRKMHDEYPWEV